MYIIYQVDLGQSFKLTFPTFNFWEILICLVVLGVMYAARGHNIEGNAHRFYYVVTTYVSAIFGGLWPLWGRRDATNLGTTEGNLATWKKMKRIPNWMIERHFQVLTLE